MLASARRDTGRATRSERHSGLKPPHVDGEPGGSESPNFLSPHVLGMTLLVEQLGFWLQKTSGFAVSPARHAYRLVSVNRFTRDSACEPSHACLRCPCMSP